MRPSTWETCQSGAVLSCTPSITVVKIESNRLFKSHMILASVLSILNKHHFFIELLSTSEVHFSTAIRLSRSQHHTLLRTRNILQPYGDITFLLEMAMVGLTGFDGSKIAGVAGRMLSVLQENAIPVEMTSLGVGDDKLCCVIPASDTARALSLLHSHL